jgi:hypothetical protein
VTEDCLETAVSSLVGKWDLEEASTELERQQGSLLFGS